MDATVTTKPPAASLKRGAFTLTAANMLDFGLQFLLPIALVRLLPTAAFADYRLAWLAIGAAMAVAPFALPRSLLYFVARTPDADKPHYVHQTFLLMLVTGAAAGLLLGPWNPLLPASLRAMADAAWFMPAFLSLWVAAYLIEFLPTARADMPGQARVILALAVLRVLMVGVAAFSGRADVVFGALVLYAAVKFALVLAHIGRHYGWKMLPLNRPALRTQWRYALPFGLSAALFLLRGQADQWVAAALFPAAVYAAFSIGAVINPIVSLVRNSVSNAIVPRLSALESTRDQAGMLRLNQRANLAAAFVLLPTLALVAVLAEHIVGVVLHIGGEEVQHALLSRHLARRGFEVTSLVGDFGQRPVEHIGGVSVRKLYRLRDGVPGLRFFTPRLTSTWAAMKAAAADIYYLSCASPMVGVMAAYCRRHNKRFVFRIASDADCAPDTLMVTNARDRMLYHYGLHRADRILAQTQKQADLLLANYGLRAEVAGMLQDLPDSVKPFDERATDLLWLANLRSMKRPAMFLDIVRLLPDLRCEMAGGSLPDEQDLYRQVEQGAAALPNLAFHGQVRFGATRALFANARVFVNTSSFEGFPNTYLQAWANGVPVVATFDPDGLIARRGLGVAVQDAAGAAAAARALLASPAEWAACSARCRAYAHERLAPDTVSAPYIAAMVAA